MSNITQLPDLAKSFAKMKIEDALRLVTGNTLTEIAIQVGVRENRIIETIEMVKSQLHDNPRCMDGILKDEIIKAIIKY